MGMLRKAGMEMMHTTIIIFILLFLFDTAFAEPRLRPLKWARPVIDTKVENFHKISDNLYRSAQPDAEGMRELASYGIGTIISLRNFHDDEDEAEGLSPDLKQVKMNTWDIREEQVIRALKLIRDSKKPVLVHCMHGADRTGLICAMSRIVFENWSKAQALDELVNGGYGYHSIWKNIIKYIDNADINKVKTGLKEGG